MFDVFHTGERGQRIAITDKDLQLLVVRHLE